jgi:hypothetical protein
MSTTRQPTVRLAAAADQIDYWIRRHVIRRNTGRGFRKPSLSMSRR